MPPSVDTEDTDYDHGFGTKKGDKRFQTKGEALKAATDFVTEQFEGGEVTRAVRSGDERTVTHRGSDALGNPVTVTIRDDKDNPSTIVPDLTGALDVSSKKLTPRGRQVKDTRHFAYEEE